MGLRGQGMREGKFVTYIIIFITIIIFSFLGSTVIMLSDIGILLMVIKIRILIVVMVSMVTGIIIPISTTSKTNKSHPP